MASRKRTGARRCGHEASYVTQRWEDGVCLGVERRYCMDCRETLPLGPAKLDGEHAEAVAIEVRAAELAAFDRDVEAGRPCAPALMTSDESHGWRDFAGDGGGDCWCRDMPGHLVRNWHAGYLARAIATHTEES